MRAARYVMENRFLYPTLGKVLQTVITGAGYRPALELCGLTDDLDGIDDVTRLGSLNDRMLAIECALSDRVTEDCGGRWAEALRYWWRRGLESVKELSLSTPLLLLADDSGRKAIADQFDAPVLVSVFQALMRDFPGINESLWWHSPFNAWVDYVVRHTEVSRQEVRDAVLEDSSVCDRTLERWETGEPITKLRPPYKDLLGNALRRENTNSLNDIYGWLTVAIAYQSIAPTTRKGLGAYSKNQAWRTWGPLNEYRDLTMRGLSRLTLCDTPAVENLITFISDNDGVRNWNIERVRKDLNQARADLAGAPSAVHAWLNINVAFVSARLAAMDSDVDGAAVRYNEAVSLAWWRAGHQQVDIIEEALIFSVGVGRAVDYKKHWDRLVVLGVNQNRAQKLDQAELNRMAAAFRTRFPLLSTKLRSAPMVEFDVEPYRLNATDKQHPNRKKKYADDGARRTPLMHACEAGSVADVQALIKSGGDPNTYIPETGASPLSAALRGAIRAGSTDIVCYLLSQNISGETANRVDVTGRETPLQLAIELGDSVIVERLLGKGADIEHAEEGRPFPLHYALIRLDRALGPIDMDAAARDFIVQGKAGILEAMSGTITDTGSAHARADIVAKLLSSERGRQIGIALLERMKPNADNARSVVLTLLKNGADSNRAFRRGDNKLGTWTPILYAQEIGESKVLDAMLGQG